MNRRLRTEHDIVEVGTAQQAHAADHAVARVASGCLLGLLVID